MTDIKAIETVYNGYKFRSRLEARWAVFFDAYGIVYEYEHEGFELKNGMRYLPDFYLPGLDTFVEIKPILEMALIDVKKMDSFALDGEKQLLLIVGSPTYEHMFLINRCTATPFEEFYDEVDSDITDAEVVASYFEQAMDYCAVEFKPSPKDRTMTLTFKGRFPNDDAHHTLSLLKGKQARFEHGKKG